ncbi:hypothetical protein D3C78_1638230 [compost metagenome]
MSRMALVWTSVSSKRLIRAWRASSVDWAARMMRTTSSRFSWALSRPRTMCSRASALRSSKRVRRVTTSMRWSM